MLSRRVPNNLLTRPLCIRHWLASWPPGPSEPYYTWFDNEGLGMNYGSLGEGVRWLAARAETKIIFPFSQKYEICENRLNIFIFAKIS
jgi:hypothetical protein